MYLQNEQSRHQICFDCTDSAKKKLSRLWHHAIEIFVEAIMEWWVFVVELGVPAIIGLAIYLTLRK